LKAIVKDWFLEGFNIFSKLGMYNMMKITEVLEMDSISKGESVDLPESHNKSVFFLKKGSIKIIDTTNNSVKYIVKRGNIFGELSLFDEELANEEKAYALEDCVVCYIDADKMEGFMEKHKSLKNGVIKIYGLRIKKLERRLHDLLYKDSRTRITEFIYDYIKEFGDVNETGDIVAKKLLSHKEIANLTNTSRQTVNNVMSALRKDNIIDYNTKTISINKEHLIEE